MTHVEGRFEWDGVKAEKNFVKHGVSFPDAARIFDGDEVSIGVRTMPDGEVRLYAVGMLDGLLVIAVVFTDRSGRIRIISARLASREERRLYHEKRNRN